MSAYTRRQEIYAKYMLCQIGFSSENDIEDFLAYLEELYGKMECYPNDNYVGGLRWKVSVSKCIAFLKEEIELKKRLYSIKLCNNANFSIRAIDLSNFTYCPVSYSISRSFIIEYPSVEKLTETGLMLHEQLGLLQNLYNIEESVNHKSYNISNAILLHIKNSRVVSFGHGGDSMIYVNKEYSGTPDYIFQDKQGNYFVVEEKFRFKRDPNKLSYIEIVTDMIDSDNTEERKSWADSGITFYKNHQVQVISYLKNIIEYDLKYGYLIYWFYDFGEKNQPYIHKVSVKKIVLDEYSEKLYTIAKNGIHNLLRNSRGTIDVSSINMKKCAGCVVNKYCYHKTRHFPEYEFPYNKEKMKLSIVEFPEELKKNRTI